ncbi:MAG: hypothetical protein CMO01_08120 [Thalassobius sp.]|nr:hypothetical protein [Thalassovita sp.]
MQIFSKYLVSRKELTASEKEVGALKKEISSARLFVKKIEEGYLDTSYPEVDENQVTAESLPGSLISMRNQLKNLNLTESQRKWTSEGLAFFSEVLRRNQQDLDETSHDIISNLVKYLKVNQGAFYIVNQEKNVLELTACYAYDRRKYVERNIKFGEGLIGQIYLEGETLLLQKLPENYLTITSGLGEASPSTLVMVPLKLDEEVMGIIELASFHQIEQYQIDFLEKLGESIASIISSIRVTAKTQHLLAQSQQQAESLRSQEEELRQNMEELSATQEEMQRVMKEVQGNEVFIRDLINSSSDSIFAIDKNYQILLCNTSTKAIYKGYGLQIDKGFNVLDIVSNEEKQKYQSFYDRALNGESFEVTEHYKFKEEDQYFVIVYSPLRDTENEIIGAACFGKNITETIVAKERAEKLLAETQEQSDILKQQEEVLLENMKELTATQGEIQKTLKATEAKELFIRNLIDASADSIFVIDSQYKLLQFNKTFLNLIASLGIQIEEGSDVFVILAEEERSKHKALYDRVFEGETFQVTEHIQLADAYYLSTYTPIFDDKKAVSACAVFAKDVTEVFKSKQQVDVLLQESKRQEEEIRSKMTAINESGMLSVEFDLKGNIRAANSNYLQLMGYSIEELEGAHHHIFVPSAYRNSKAYQSFWDSLAEGKSQMGEYERVKKDGNIVYLHGSYSIIRDNVGKPKNVIKLAVDITASKKAQIALESQASQIEEQDKILKESMDQLSAKQAELDQQMATTSMLNNELDARMAVLNESTILSESDIYGTITYVNDKFCEVSQFTREELIGKPHKTVRHPDTPKAFFKAFWKTIQSGKTFRGFLKNRKKDGSPYYVDAVISPVLDEKGNVLKYIAARYVIEDVELAERLLKDQGYTTGN